MAKKDKSNLYELEPIIGDSPENLSSMWRVPYQGITQQLVQFPAWFAEYKNIVDEWCDHHFETGAVDHETEDFLDRVISSARAVARAEVEIQDTQVKSAAAHVAAAFVANEVEIIPMIECSDDDLDACAARAEHSKRMYQKTEGIRYEDIEAADPGRTRMRISRTTPNAVMSLRDRKRHGAENEDVMKEETIHG